MDLKALGNKELKKLYDSYQFGCGMLVDPAGMLQKEVKEANEKHEKEYAGVEDELLSRLTPQPVGDAADLINALDASHPHMVHTGTNPELCEALRTAIASMQAELAALRKDWERLEWCFCHKYHLWHRKNYGGNIGTEYHITVIRDDGTEFDTENFDTPRAAIDAAMEAMKG